MFDFQRLHQLRRIGRAGLAEAEQPVDRKLSVAGDGNIGFHARQTTIVIRQELEERRTVETHFPGKSGTAQARFGYHAVQAATEGFNGFLTLGGGTGCAAGLGAGRLSGREAGSGRRRCPKPGTLGQSGRGQYAGPLPVLGHLIASFARTLLVNSRLFREALFIIINISTL